ncbi:lipase [Oscillatoria sp. FACHB-1407]|uniref:DUF1796 family putative cysteine peptidase n=1 Tax=Oscillatoria sp. FACHB-1407 TaxID=2692847 RepID=UPI0016889001|nr:DUF1796 family putative cysteine peptidase [Oscillatoria sp. FACHB-1407]MBD2461235.1 lipase [Oscillatoria sp. FACHB-1407]
MYRFQISALTQPGEAIALVGSIPQMGSWDVNRCVRLQTRRDRYPVWSVDLDLTGIESPPEYKYIRLRPDGGVEWEAWGSNRWVPIEPEPLPSPVIVEDGAIGTIPSYPYGYYANPVAQPVPQHQDGLKIVVIGSSVALGCSAWLLHGWAWHLGQTLQRFGHHLVNVSEIGTNVSTTIARFSQVVAPEDPDIVIIALSLGNEGLASSAPLHQRAIQRRFENGLQQLIKMTRELGAIPMLGGVYPNGGYTLEHYRLLQETHQRMQTWGVPVLDWLSVLDDGQGRWKPGIWIDPAHPNTIGHRLMAEAIDLSLFHRSKADLATIVHPHLPTESPIYQDSSGFHLFTRHAENSLRVINTSSYSYTLSPQWQNVQTALQAARLPAGIYIAENSTSGTSPFLFIQDDGAIETTMAVPPSADLRFYPAFHFFVPHRSDVVFYDGHLGILKVSDSRLYVINESDHDYNLHPMWKEVRAALRAMPSGVYRDPLHPDAPFRTLMIGNEGLESRVKVAPRSAMVLDYQCSLAEVSRVAIIPLGDRCAVRMLLYKLEYDGPAFPFDLTRTTNLADVADMIQSGFEDMWNPAFLHYNHDARRIYHTKWSGLSFAHEAEESDDPVNDMSPVYERMRVRYTARSERFWYTLRACDKALFVRTGLCDRNSVVDLVHKLEAKCEGKPFRLLLISPQSSDEFADLANVLHYNLEFNPDRMYDDLGHWLYCTELMRGILDSLGVSSQNLFWCPPNPPKDVA